MLATALSPTNGTSPTVRSVRQSHSDDARQAQTTVLPACNKRARSIGESRSVAGYSGVQPEGPDQGFRMFPLVSGAPRVCFGSRGSRVQISATRQDRRSVSQSPAKTQDVPMGIHVGIEHRTTYRFDRSVQIHPHVLRLRPAPHCRTPILAYSLRVTPSEHFINWQQDPFGNFMARLVFPEPARLLDVTVDLIADLTVINPFDFFVEESAKAFPFTYEPQLAKDLEPYLRPDGIAGPVLQKWLDSVPIRDGGLPIADFLVELNQRLYRDIAYSIRMEPGVQAPEDTLTRSIGSCRDTGWLLVDILRRLGLAARFASGYLVQLTSDQLSLNGADGPAADFTDLHAWAEVFIPGAGWIGLDPTSGLFAGEGHIPLACTPHPTTAAPISGHTGPAEVTFEFSNVVHRVREDPRVTLPYTPEQWSRIDEVGEFVDQRLDAGDVRLTMGGEPTFVSIDDMEGAEWNTAADGAAKRTLAHELALRMYDRFADGGLIQHGQGKWYPGEPLPRWQLGIVWRHDGQPLWTPRHLLADPSAPGTTTIDTARQFAEDVAARFGLGSDHLIPAYEDPIDEAWREARLPAGEPPTADVDPSEADRRDQPDVRVKLVERLRGVDADPAGFVLPLHPAPDGDGWRTTTWHLRRERLYLIAGDSPLGLRLPLDSLTWSPLPVDFERSPFEPRGELPAHGSSPTRPATIVERHEAAPTALAFEVRDGHLRVFLPPLENAEHAVELVGVLESVAVELGCPIVIEGYALPRDPRLSTLIITPDPGVIEVNVQPSSTGGTCDISSRCCTRKPGSRASEPRSSRSTEATPAPAAAITSPSAGPLRPTVPCYADQTSCRAWSRSGSTTRRCPTCSRVSSSGRPVRHHASTKAGSTLSTNSRSPSPNSNDRARTHLHG